MADYAKKTNADLQEILKSRGLPTSGKKAELIARLNENDKQASEQEAPAVSDSDPAAVTAAEPATDSAAIAPTGSVEQPVTDPTSTATEIATAAIDHPSPDTSLAAQTNYSLNLPTSTLDTELAKRKARAERFGTGNAPAAPAGESATTTTSDPTAISADPSTTLSDAAALRNLERAKRFGTGQTAIGKLDEALPSEVARGSRKRGHAHVTEGTELDDPGLKRTFANRGRGRGGKFNGARSRGTGGGAGGGGRGAAAAAKPQGIQKGGAPAYTSEKDKLAAEARKKKFATA